MSSATLLAICLLALAPRGADALMAVCPGGITYAGECTGDLLQWCENGEVIQIDCGEQGAVCAWSDAKEFYTCMEADPVQTECELYGDLTWAGDCVDANTLVWCSNDVIETLECKEGMVCDWDALSVEYNCIQEGSSSPTEIAPPEGGGDRSDGFGGESEESSPEEPASESPSPTQEDEDIAEQARVIRGGTPGSDGKEDDSQPSFFGDPGAEEPASGCSVTRTPTSGVLLAMAMIALLWIRTRRQTAP